LVAEVLARLIGGATLATGGWRLGEYISDVWGPELYMPWVFGLTIGGAIVGFIATPYVTVRSAQRLIRHVESIPTSRLLSGLLGLVLGLLIALLLSIPLTQLPGWFGIGLPIVLSVFMAYLGTVLLSSPERDVFRSLMHGEANTAAEKSWSQSNKVVLDTSAIIDGRIADITRAGFLKGTVVVPQFILDELRHIADSSDSMRRARGRRGLEVLNSLKEIPHIEIQVIGSSYRNGHEVDAMLVEVAREIGASIVTTDYNLNRVAHIQGIAVLNVNELANSMRPVVLPGEDMSVRVVQEGKEPGQGVGFMDDGTMVVIEGGNRYLNAELDVLVTRVLQTAAGCIIFAQPKRN
jgi:uncharacterized protein YacL